MLFVKRHAQQAKTPAPIKLPLALQCYTKLAIDLYIQLIQSSEFWLAMHIFNTF